MFTTLLGLLRCYRLQSCHMTPGAEQEPKSLELRSAEKERGERWSVRQQWGGEIESHREETNFAGNLRHQGGTCTHYVNLLPSWCSNKFVFVSELYLSMNYTSNPLSTVTHRLKLWRGDVTIRPIIVLTLILSLCKYSWHILYTSGSSLRLPECILLTSYHILTIVC